MSDDKNGFWDTEEDLKQSAEVSDSALLPCYVAVCDMTHGQMFYDDDGYLWRKADGCWAVRLAGGKPWIFSRFAKWRLAT